MRLLTQSGYDPGRDILSRCAAVSALVGAPAPMVLLQPADAFAPQARSETYIEQITHLTQTLQTNYLVNLQLDLRFLTLKLDGALRRLADAEERSARMSAAPASRSAPALESARRAALEPPAVSQRRARERAEAYQAQLPGPRSAPAETLLRAEEPAAREPSAARPQSIAPAPMTLPRDPAQRARSAPEAPSEQDRGSARSSRIPGPRPIQAKQSAPAPAGREAQPIETKNVRTAPHVPSAPAAQTIPRAETAYTPAAPAAQTVPRAETTYTPAAPAAQTVLRAETAHTPAAPAAQTVLRAETAYTPAAPAAQTILRAETAYTPAAPAAQTILRAETARMPAAPAAQTILRAETARAPAAPAAQTILRAEAAQPPDVRTAGAPGEAVPARSAQPLTAAQPMTTVRSMQPAQTASAAPRGESARAPLPAQMIRPEAQPPQGVLGAQAAQNVSARQQAARAPLGRFAAQDDGEAPPPWMPTSGRFAPGVRTHRLADETSVLPVSASAQPARETRAEAQPAAAKRDPARPPAQTMPPAQPASAAPAATRQAPARAAQTAPAARTAPLPVERTLPAQGAHTASPQAQSAHTSFPQARPAQTSAAQSALASAAQTRSAASAPSEAVSAPPAAQTVHRVVPHTAAPAAQGTPAARPMREASQTPRSLAESVSEKYAPHTPAAALSAARPAAGMTPAAPNASAASAVSAVPSASPAPDARPQSAPPGASAAFDGPAPMELRREASAAAPGFTDAQPEEQSIRTVRRTRTVRQETLPAETRTAINAPGRQSPAEAQRIQVPPAEVERIADKVYRQIEARLRSEKQRRGM